MPTRTRARAARHSAGRFPDRYLLYTAAVQDVEIDIEHLIDIYGTANGTAPTLLREDFCGTAALACQWVRGGPNHHALGLDLHTPTLAWARRRRVPQLGAAAARLKLLHADVRTTTRPGVDVIAALNFSYWVFWTRDQLREYFIAARRSLRPGGVMVMDAYGGSETMQAAREASRVGVRRGPAGERIAPFTYVWEQESFNPIDHRLRCHITFRLGPGRVMHRAFSYDWRMWMLPELQEVLGEAGFRDSLVYIQDWDDAAGEPLATFSRRKRFENQAGWLAYVVGLR